MCGKYPAHLKYRQFYIPGHKILKSTSYFSLAGPRIRLQRAHGIGKELFAERSQLPDMLHTHTQRLIYFGGRKRGLSYAAIGSKEIHFTLTQIEKDRQTHTNLNIRHTKNSLFLFRSKEQRRKIKTG